MRIISEFGRRRHFLENGECHLWGYQLAQANLHVSTIVCDPRFEAYMVKRDGRWFSWKEDQLRHVWLPDGCRRENELVWWEWIRLWSKMYRFCDLLSATKEPTKGIKQKVVLFNPFGNYQKQKASIMNIKQLHQTKSVTRSLKASPLRGGLF